MFTLTPEATSRPAPPAPAGDQQPAMRVPGLDGLRAIAVVGVLFCHLQLGDFLVSGGLGVDVFFVISGFLITSLLMTELRSHGRVALGRFYVRRAVRLLPVLLVVVATWTAFSLAFPDGPWSSGTLKSVPWVLGYGEDIYRAVVQPSLTQAGLLAHTWSLSVEEQFYVLGPPVLILLTRGRLAAWRVGLLLVAAAGAEWCYRLVAVAHGWSPNRVYFAPDLHSDGLLVGCGLAFLLAAPGVRAALGKRPRITMSTGIGCLAVIVALFAVKTSPNVAYVIAIPATTIATAAVVAALATVGLPGPGRLLESRAVVWLGVRSYGLYLWHLPIFFGLFSNVTRTPFTVVAEITLALIVCAASWRFLEAPCNRLRGRFRPAAPETSLPPAT